MASYLDENRPDFGQMSMNAAGFDSAERNAGVAAMGEMGATGIGAQAAVEAAELVGAAQASAAGDAATGSMFGALGQIAGAGIGTIGKGPVGGYEGSVNSPGFGMDRSKQVGIGSYGGSVGGYGTFGPNWGFPSS